MHEFNALSLLLLIIGASGESRGLEFNQDFRIGR